MNTNTIRRGLTTNIHTRQYFKDVIPCDYLPTAGCRQRGAYVVNTHTSEKGGEHWVVICFHPKTLLYFDPYGRPPTPTIRHYLKKTKALKGRVLRCNKTRYQGFRETCGYYCMYFILTVATPTHNMNIFYDNLELNDGRVRRIVKELFPV
jgi:hypothetical protein